MDDLPAIPRKGRGAIGNPTGRFEAAQREAFDDGWGGLEEEPGPLVTTFVDDATRSIIARNDSPDISFDRSINPYRGCEHGCIYCFARPGHSYLGLSAGLDFETRIFVKEKAPELLAAELRKKNYSCQPIAIGTNTDPYQPVERKLKIMRGILEVLRDFEHPVGIVTKSALIQRDIDILAPMAEKRLAKVAVSLTTLDRKLARIMEPRAASPERRLDTIGALSAAGIPTAVMTAPMIPALNDAELEQLLEAAVARGASSAGYVLVRLPHEVKTLFREWLDTHWPDKADHVMSLLRQAHGGKAYEAEWGKRMSGSGPYAEMLRLRFQKACERLGISRQNVWKLDTTRFRPPPQPGDQLKLF